jgi:hypothetical protein
MLVVGVLGCLLCASAQAKPTVFVPSLDRAARSPSQPPPSKFVYINVGKGTVVKQKSGQYVMHFAVTLSRSSQHQIFVTLKTAGVTAKAGKEFTAQNKQISFKPGQTVVFFDVPLVNPNTHPSQFFYLKELNPVGAQLGNGEGIGLVP